MRGGMWPWDVLSLEARQAVLARRGGRDDGPSSSWAVVRPPGTNGEPRRRTRWDAKVEAVLLDDAPIDISDLAEMQRRERPDLRDSFSAFLALSKKEVPFKVSEWPAWQPKKDISSG